MPDLPELNKMRKENRKPKRRLAKTNLQAPNLVIELHSNFAECGQENPTSQLLESIRVSLAHLLQQTVYSLSPCLSSIIDSPDRPKYPSTLLSEHLLDHSGQYSWLSVVLGSHSGKKASGNSEIPILQY